MDNDYLLHFSETFTRSWNFPYPSEDLQQEYFCHMDFYPSEINFTQLLPTRPEAHVDSQNLLELGNTSYMDLQPEHNVQLDPFCQEFNFVQGLSTAISEAQRGSHNVPDSGNTSDTSCSPTVSQSSGDLLASAVNVIGEEFYEELCSSEPSSSPEVQVTAGPVAYVPIDQELLGFQVLIGRGKDANAAPFKVSKFLSIFF
jgi:hypothetical protein